MKLIQYNVTQETPFVSDWPIRSVDTVLEVVVVFVLVFGTSFTTFIHLREHRKLTFWDIIQGVQWGRNKLLLRHAACRGIVDSKLSLVNDNESI